MSLVAGLHSYICSSILNRMSNVAVLEPTASVVAEGPRRTLLARLAWLHRQIDRIADAVGTEAGLIGAGEVAEVERAIRRLEGVKLGLVARADREQAHRRHGATSTSAWLADLTRSGGASASAQVSLAAALDSGLDATRSALSAGEVSARSAAIIAQAMHDLPDDLTAQDRLSVESALVRDARRLDPAKLRRRATLALADAQRSAAEAAAHQERVLLDQERRAYQCASITFHDRGDGTTRGEFVVPTGAAHVLKKVLEAMTAPRRARRFTQESAEGSVADQLLDESATAPGGRNDDWAALSWAERKGRAFAEILEHLPTDRLTGRVAATVVVTMTLEQVEAAAALARESGVPSVGAVACDTGHQLSTSAARRLACNAGILPAVLGGASLPLDLGRQERLFSEAQRVVLATRYTECAALGCDRPYAWTELHHDPPWSRGGPTDLAHAIPLCGAHHRMVHDPAFAHEVAHVEGALKEVRFTMRT